MRKPIVAGNWKMNGTSTSVKQLIASIITGLQTPLRTEVVIFPPYVYLERVANNLQDGKMRLGAQNVSQYADGAYTGEISASMLKDFNCEYVLVGHSERRNLFAESDEQVAAKFFAAAQTGLKPVLCVGETLKEREAGKTFAIIAQQLVAVFEGQEDILTNWQQAVIAYEPVWAIGTGVTATPNEAQEVHAYIRKFVEKYDKTLAQNLRILYGGSVKSSNAQQLFAMPDIDGGLIGGASLQAKEFLELISICNNYC